MNLRSVIAVGALALATSMTGPALVSPASATTLHVDHAAKVAPKKHACTRTSSGKCIKGGQFCPQSKYKKSGWDAKGRRYVCKGNRTHPHWMKP
jgi:hypothetical protein